MIARLSAAGLALAAALVILPIASAQLEEDVVQQDTVKLPLGLENWDIRQMEQDPVKVIRIQGVKRRIRLPPPETKPEGKPEPRETFQEQTSAEIILEFVRDLTVRDTDWTGVRPEPPFRFQFEDKDGVTLWTQPARYEGIVLGRKGRRVRVIVPMPPKPILDRTKKIVVDPRRYGESPWLTAPAASQTGQYGIMGR
jgi:hypothetical protein